MANFDRIEKEGEEMKSASLRLTLLAILCLGFVPLAGSSASAAFPGANGKIAFTSDRDGNGEIYVMNADGSGQTNLTNNVKEDWGPAISPDGTTIAFTRALGDGQGQEVFVMNADGSGQTNLTNTPADQNDPAWSPNGTKIAFMSNRNHPGEIYVMNANGSNPTNLTNNPAVDLQPAFSPNGSQMAFVSDRFGGNNQIHAMNVDGSGQIGIITSPHDQDPDFSPDGTKIAFTSFRDDNAEVYVMDVNGVIQTPLTTNLAGDFQPDFSPDGTKIAFTNTASNPEIYVMNADGLGQTNLTNNAAQDQLPDWGVAENTPPNMPPTVFSVNPSEGQTGIPRKTNVTITFSEEMDTSTFDANTVKLTRGTTSIPFTMTTSTDGLGRTILALNPFGSTAQMLGKKKTYTVRIEGAADTDGFTVEDLAGNDLAEDKVWTFRTKRR
jgi:TolB protein